MNKQSRNRKSAIFVSLYLPPPIEYTGRNVQTLGKVMSSHTNTSLHIAIQNGNMEIIKMLLADGCESLYTRNAEGQTPLDLAAAMNNEEIVRLLLEYGAGHPFPQPPSDFSPVILDTEQRKKRITFLTIFFVILCGILTFVSASHELITIGILTAGFEPYEIEEITEGVFILHLLLLGLPSIIAYILFYFFWVFRLWEEIPWRFARTTPGMAAGLSLIPIFGWYWMFVALGGLYQDMNKVMEAYGHGRRFNTTLIIVACIIWLLNDLGFLILAVIFGLVAAFDPVSPFVIFSHFALCIFYFLWCVFTIVICWIIRGNVLEFMDIKRSLEGG